MRPTSTLQERERELQSLLATAEGREQVQELACRYATMGSKLRPPGKSVVTHILVYERELGLIDN